MSVRFSQYPLLRVIAVAVLAAAPARLLSQATISGHVTAAGGAPLNGVTVSVGGMGVGSMTDAAGAYSFTVPANRVTGQAAILNARRVGYSPQAAQIILSNGAIRMTTMAAAAQLEQ